MDSEQIIRQVSTKVMYKNQYMTLREDEIERPDGSRGIYSYIVKPDFALVIAMENDGFHLVEQYRYPTGQRSWEFPQGTFPQGREGSAEDLAREELQQETGITAGALRHLGRLHCAKGLTGQAFDVFLAEDLTHGQAELEPEEQDLRHVWFPRGEVETMIRRGEITDDSTLGAYLLLVLGPENDQS